MTDDAYLFLVDDPAERIGVPPAEVGPLACMETPAVRAWLDAQGVSALSPRLRLMPPEETGAIEADAERLPVPLGEEELSRLRHGTAPKALVGIEGELLAYRDCAEGRDELLTRALAAGVAPHRIAELTGEDPAVVRAAATS
ncbi:hypothetical protein GT045_22505 [Streptomyces sp. SID486]|uniref:DUF6003 family protein n=1 Tax=unclassified Streptomyces TaxID=2593676 RepID=UPI00136FC184|nr:MULTISPECIES: DUF6003 family protein [unclassified Streptomyces]MYW17904.1 hypothetical protein [Streptomyces sp. SID2955]MYW45932.1 hypothetical protein [Streptomyces sp. SID161]MYX97510.1 hypothetical protein [Streptomyces sp. SID486]